MNVMRRLRRAPEGQLAVGVKVRQGGMLLQWEMRVAFVKERVLADEICFSKPGFHVAEFQRDLLVYIAALAIILNARFRRLESLRYRRNRLQPFVFDMYQVHRLECR